MEESIRQFFEERCMEERGATCRAVNLYEEFSAWWHGRNTVAIPSRKNFFRLVPSKYLRVKFAGAVVFRELRIRPAAVG